ncbi:MAG: hypothetical protein ACREQC_10330 [Candidatus Binataceae bacterium]
MNSPAAFDRWTRECTFLAFAVAFALIFTAASPAHARAAHRAAFFSAALAHQSASSTTASPTITFRKVFKSSYPEFVEIRVNPSGSGSYDIRALDDPPSPQPFELGTALAQKIFALAARLHDFQGVDLEIHHRIANLGEKTFIYENGGEKHEISFNYTLDESASQLLDIFEGLSRQEMDLSDLQRTMRYDRLGVNDILLRIDDDYSHKLLPAPEAFLPFLDQISSDDRFIDMARQRSGALATKIRAAH